MASGHPLSVWGKTPAGCAGWLTLLANTHTSFSTLAYRHRRNVCSTKETMILTCSWCSGGTDCPRVHSPGAAGVSSRKENIRAWRLAASASGTNPLGWAWLLLLWPGFLYHPPLTPPQWGTQLPGRGVRPEPPLSGNLSSHLCQYFRPWMQRLGLTVTVPRAQNGFPSGPGQGPS